MTGPAERRTVGELIAAARADDPRAWKQLVARYDGMVTSVVTTFRLQPADAADAVQSTWLQAFEQLDTLRQPERFGGWLKTIAFRECLALPVMGRRERLDAHVAEHVVAQGPGPEAEVLRAEIRRAVRAALDTLSGRRRSLMEALFYRPFVDYAHTAQVVDMPLGSIGPTRARTLRLLRDHLERSGFAPASDDAEETDGEAAAVTGRRRR